MSADQKKILKAEYKSFINQKEFIPHIPDPNKLTLWHFTFAGPKDTPFEGGFYHIEVNLAEYPDKAPIVRALNENGSFQQGQALCLHTLTHYHQEQWQKIDLMTLMVGIQASLTQQDGRSGIGIITDINSSKAVANIKNLAQKSNNFECPQCKKRIAEFGAEALK